MKKICDNRNCTVNLVKLAPARELERHALVATEWENPLIEVTCNNSGRVLIVVYIM